ncbi:SOS response-associated peptidase family protein [Roseateles sp. BYS78W]|uniref:Abasic site processing protein n=1 Tax=Pelomonas candidula TaxID=3299025 RepID=A0ABW7HKY2_9BURK
MRSHLEPVTDASRLLAAFGVALPIDVQLEPADGADALALFIVPAEHPSSGALGDVNVGRFGLLPGAALDAGMATQTRHCRVETMKSNPTFRQSWWSGWRCVIPVERLSQWSHASGQPAMWHIGRTDEQPMGLAGLWSAWTSPAGETQLSFCVLTVSGEGHALFDRLNPPGHDRRMPVILPAEAQRPWLHGTGAQAERLLVRFPAEQLQASPQEPANWPSRLAWPDEGDLFADEWWPAVAEAPRRKRVVVRRRAPDVPMPITGDLFA